MLFSLSLSTLTEYSSFNEIIYGCIIPSLVGCVLYTVDLHHPIRDGVAIRCEAVGFGVWAALLTINVVRVVFAFAKRALGIRQIAKSIRETV